MDQKTLAAEIRKFVQDRLDAGIILHAEWVTLAVIEAREAPTGDDADFFLLCAREHIYEIVKKVIGKYTPKPQLDKTDPLPGFEHLQRGYPVVRDGVKMLVPTDLCTEDELLARADEYDAMAAGCIAHAQEIRSYIKGRAARRKA